MAPELKIPVANERSLAGNQSPTVFIAAGKFPDSPIAKMTRLNIKPNTETGKAMPKKLNMGAITPPISTAKA